MSLTPNSSSYVTPTLTASDNGNLYKCIITNCTNTYQAITNNATLSVNSQCTSVSIGTQPQNQTANVGSTATFSVSANGTAPFLYFWYKNNIQISGANSSFYATPILTTSDNGNLYKCIITNCTSTYQAISIEATLSVNSPCDPVLISSEPTNQVVNVGNSAEFRVDVAGTGPFSYRWYDSNNNNVRNSNTPLTSDVYITPALTLADNLKSFYCVIYNCNDTEFMNSVIVSVNVINPTCITWANNSPPTKPIANTATEYLCNNGFISPNQNYAQLASMGTGEAALNTIFVRYNKNVPNSLPSNNFPLFTTDVELGTTQTDNDQYYSIKALSFLEFNDGRPCIRRDFSMISPNSAISHGKILRMILEAWKIDPDQTGFDINSTDQSTFLANIKKNDPNYGYFNIAKQMNLITDYITNNSIELTSNRGEFLYVLLYKMLTQHSKPVPVDADYYKPNNFGPTNSASEKGIEKAEFESWEQPGLTLPSGAFGLDFNFSYHTDLLDYPLISQDLSEDPNLTNGNLENLKAQIKNFPIGKGWTHSYNIYANILESSNSVEKFIMFHWGSGEVTYFNIITGKFETKGIYDELPPTDIIKDANNKIISFKVKTKNQIIYSFQKSNKQFICKTITDRNVNQISLIYEQALGCLASPTNCVGTSNERLKNVLESINPNRKINFTYKTASDLIDSVYDGTRAVKFVTNLNTTTNNFSLESFSDPKKQNTYYNYCLADTCRNLLTSIQRPKGNTITNTYTKRRLKQNTNNNYSVKVTFNPNYQTSNVSTQSFLKITQNGQELQTTYTHDVNGNLQSVTSQTDDITNTYGNANNPTLPTLTTNVKTQITQSFDYDTRGNVLSTTKSGPGLAPITNTFNYNLFNDLTNHIDPRSGTTTLTYDVKGNLISKMNPLSDVTSFNINPLNGLVNYTTNPEGIKTIFGYNTYGNLTSIQNDLSPTSFIKSQATYDDLSRITAITNPKNIQTTYLYDLNDNVTKVTEDPTGLNLATSYQYDLNDNLTKITNARNYATDLTYDFDTDDLKQETFGLYSKNWTYNTDGTTKSFTNKKGDIFNYQYYPAGDSREGLLKDDGYSIFDYNTTTKNLSTITKGSKIFTYSYDGFQRISGINYNDFIGNNVTYGYDANNNVTLITYPGAKSFTYEYNLNNRLTKIIDWQSRVLVQYIYLLDGRLASETHGNGTSTIYHYDAVGRLDSLANKKANGTLIGYFANKLDLVGNITKETRNEPENNFTPSLLTQTNTYLNDATNRQTAINGATVGYDNNGNQTSFDGTAYTWDIRDRLLNATLPSSNLAFDYDPLGNRRLKNNTRYVLDILNGSNVLMETDINGAASSLYVHGLGLVCRLDIGSNTYSYYHSDMRGSTTAITDASGNTITHKYIYNPDGELFQNTETFSQPFKYVGKYGVMSDAPNLTFMRARYYNPKTGRFLSEDPVWSTNLYPYAGNNSIRNIDPDGEKAKKATSFISQIPKIGKGIDKVTNNGKIFGTQYADNAVSYYENKYIESVVSGKTNNLLLVGLGFSSLWTSSNYKTTLSALSMGATFSGAGLTSVIGKTGNVAKYVTKINPAIQFLDMRSKLGIGLKGGADAYNTISTALKYDLYGTKSIIK